jgi:hypothetical protein
MPSDEAVESIEQAVHDAVMNSLSEVIKWPSNGA